MADAVRGLKVKLGADTAAFNRAMDRSRKKTNDLGNLMKKAFTATAVIAAASQIVQANVEMEKSLDSLQAITGATDQDMQFYAKSAQAIGPATKRSASDIVKAFELVGSAKPELLASKEALTAVTKEAATLANAAGMKMEPAVDAATKVMNQFEIGASGASRVVNALAAASKAGAAPVDQVAESVKKSGTVAKAAKVSLEQHVGMIETLAEKGIVGAEAGTNLRNVLLTLQTGADDTNPAVVGLNTALENLAAKNLSAAEMSKIFGKENVVAAQILAQNVDKVKHYTNAVTDTNIANEQAAIQTGNVASAWEGLKSATGSAFIQLQKGTGPLREVLEGMSSLVLKVSGVKDETTLFLNEQSRLARENRAQADVTNALVKSFEELTAKENLSGDEKIRLQGIVQALRSDIGENAVTLNAETGEYELNTQAVKDNIQAKISLATNGEDLLIKKAAELTKKQMEHGKAAQKMNAPFFEARQRLKGYTEALDEVGLAQEDLLVVNKKKLERVAKDVLSNPKEYSDQAITAVKDLQFWLNGLSKNQEHYEVAKPIADELKATMDALVSTGMTIDEARAKVNQYIESENELSDAQKEQIDKYEALTGKQIGYTAALTDAQVAEMKAIQDKNKAAAAMTKEGLTLGEISEKLSELKKQRNDAHGPAEIAAIDAEIEKYESLADSIELAVSKMKADNSVFTMEPKTLDVIPGTATAPDVDNPPPLEMNTIGGISLGTDIDALIELQRQFEIITQKNNIYGDSLSATQQKIAATEQAIASFIERQIQSEGAFDATNPQLLELINNLQVLQEVADSLDLSENIASQVEAMNQIIEQGLENVATNMGMVIGEIAAGNAGLSDVWGVLLNGAADMAINLGKLAIQNGIAIEAIKKSLFNLQGVGAIVAGVALVALGSFVRNKAASIAGGGKAGGGAVPGLADGGVARKPSLVMIGEYPGAESDPEIVAPESKLRGIFSEQLSKQIVPPSVPQLQSFSPVALPSPQQMDVQQTVKLTGDFRVRGSDLLLAIDESSRRRERV